MIILEAKIKKIREYSFIYGLGSILYSIIEILWRGFTHWTMGIAGGLCFSCIYAANNRFRRLKLWKRCMIDTFIITSVEFFAGIFVNKIMHWNVWDYSDIFPNFLGQICLLYSFLWFLLSIPANLICSILKKRFFPDSQA